MGNWYADDIDLSTLAQGVQNRSAGWAWASRRGENIRIPGRPGTVHIDKVEDENTMVLDMWARGMESDGSIPTDTTRERKVVERLDALARLFASGRLVELVRAEDGVDYGRTNVIPNPSAEKSGGKVVVRENIIQNPSAEFSGGKQPVRWNLLSNPSMEDAAKDTVIRTNYAINPQFSAESGSKVRRTNLMPNPSIEAGVQPWSRQTGKIQRSSYKQSSPKWPVAGAGKWSLKMTSTSASDPKAVAAPIPVTPSTNYAIQAQVLNKSGAARTLRINARWRNRRGALLRSDNVDVAAIANNAIGSPNGVITSPAGAYWLVVQIIMVGVTATNQECYIDSIMVEQGNAVLPYFDGDTDENDSYRYRWVRNAGISQSEAFTVGALGWRVPNNNRIYGLTTEQARVGPKSLRIQVTNAPASRDLLVEPVVQYGSDIDPGSTVSASYTVQLGPDVAANRDVIVALNCYDSKGALIGKCWNQGTQVEHTDVTTTLEPGTWIDCEVENVVVRPKTARVCLSLYVAAGWAINDLVYVDCGLVENAAQLGKYFDGYSKDTDTFGYRWQGKANVSYSEQSGSLVTDWRVTGGLGYQSDFEPLSGDYSLRIEAPRNPVASLRLQAEATPIDIRAGDSHTLSANVRPSRAMQVRLQRSIDSGKTWTSAASVACTANVWTRLSMTAIDFTVSNETTVRVRVQTDEAPQDLDVLDIGDAMLEPVADLRDYFDGNSGRNYDWTGKEFGSLSVFNADRVDGWSAYGTGRPQIQRVSGGTAGSYSAQVTNAKQGNLGMTWAQDGIDEDLGYGFGVDITPGQAGTIRAGVEFFDKKGDLVSQDYADFAGVANTMQRVTRVVADPPAAAVVAAPFVVMLNMAPSATMTADKAVFGFGAWTDYKDGDSGGGWEWTSGGNISESRQINTAPHHWEMANGTLQQDGAWSTSRSQSALYTVNSPTGPWWFGPVNSGDFDDSRFPVQFLEYASWSVDVRAVDACRVRLAILPCSWSGWGWNAGNESSYYGGWVEMGAGTQQRLYLMQEVGGRSFDSTHFSVRVEIEKTGGGTPAIGTRVKADSAMLAFGDSLYTTYMDGESDFWVRWQGSQDESPSRRIGPARRCFVECIQAIDPTSINSDLAKFSVEVIVPTVYWEDTFTTTDNFVVGRPGSRVRLSDFIQASAPTNDAVITLWGPFPNGVKITDVGSGAWLNLDFKIHADDTVVIDNHDWTVTMNGKSMLEHVSHDGSSFLLPITPVKSEATPKLRFDADTIGSSAKARVAGVRRYRVA